MTENFHYLWSQKSASWVDSDCPQIPINMRHAKSGLNLGPIIAPPVNAYATVDMASDHKVKQKHLRKERIFKTNESRLSFIRLKEPSVTHLKSHTQPNSKSIELQIPLWTTPQKLKPMVGFEGGMVKRRKGQGLDRATALQVSYGTSYHEALSSSLGSINSSELIPTK